MYAARGDAAAAAFLRSETLAGVQERPLGERASELPGNAPRGATRSGERGAELADHVLHSAHFDSVLLAFPTRGHRCDES